MAGDANYPSVSLLLHGNGTNGANVFTDNSPAPLTPTLIGAPTTSTTQSKYGGSSMHFDGTADALQYAHTAALNLASGDFTIEGWVYVTSLTNPCVICQKDQSFGSTFVSYSFLIGSNGALKGSVGTGNTNTYSQNFSSAAGLIAVNTEYHVAFTRSGTALTLWIDGASVATAAQTGTPTDGGKAMMIGRYPSGGGSADQWFAGYLDDLRITKGVARYTGAFTPPAQQMPDGAGQVAGTVTDVSGVAVARTVRAYRRDTGAMVGNVTSDATTGAYSFYTPTVDEVDLIVLDSATTGTIYNDLIDRVIPA